MSFFRALQSSYGTIDCPTAQLKEDLLFKAPLTAFVVANFLSSYQSIASPQSPADKPAEPFVYVDAYGVKLLTNVVEGEAADQEDIFALAVAEDGWVEMLALQESNS